MGSTDTLPVVSDNPDVQCRYEAMRANGQSHNMAEMLATQCVPGLKTDTRFIARMDTRGDVPAAYRAMARKAGVDTGDKQYISQMADYPGDPKAWISGPADIRRTCRERGWGCAGAVEVDQPKIETPDDAPYQVCDENVMREAKRMAAEDPGRASTPKKRENLIEETRERLSGGGVLGCV